MSCCAGWQPIHVEADDEIEPTAVDSSQVIDRLMAKASVFHGNEVGCVGDERNFAQFGMLNFIGVLICLYGEMMQSSGECARCCHSDFEQWLAVGM